MPLKSGIETNLHRKFINFSFKAQNSHKVLTSVKENAMILNDNVLV